MNKFFAILIRERTAIYSIDEHAPHRPEDVLGRTKRNVSHLSLIENVCIGSEFFVYFFNQFKGVFGHGIHRIAYGYFWKYSRHFVHFGRGRVNGIAQIGYQCLCD